MRSPSKRCAGLLAPVALASVVTTTLLSTAPAADAASVSVVACNDTSLTTPTEAALDSGLKVCIRYEDDRFFADVTIDPEVHRSSVVTFRGLLQDDYIVFLLGLDWPALHTEAHATQPGETQFTVELPYTLTDFEAFIEQTDIGWDRIGVCVDAVARLGQVDHHVTQCASLATPTLNRRFVLD